VAIYSPTVASSSSSSSFVAGNFCIAPIHDRPTHVALRTPDSSSRTLMLHQQTWTSAPSWLISACTRAPWSKVAPSKDYIHVLTLTHTRTQKQAPPLAGVEPMASQEHTADTHIKRTGAAGTVGKRPPLDNNDTPVPDLADEIKTPPASDCGRPATDWH